MAAEGTVVDPERPDRHHRRPAGDRPRLQGADPPRDTIVAEAPPTRWVPTFGAYEADVVQIEMDADGMPIDELEQTLDQLAAHGRRPKSDLHHSQLPQPRGGDDVAAAAPAAGGGGARARELLISRTTPTGCCATRGRRSPRSTRSTRVPAATAPAPTSSSTSGRSRRSFSPACASAGRWRPAPCSRSSTSANRAPTCAARRSPSCSSPPTFASGTGAEYLEQLEGDLTNAGAT